MIDFFGTVRTTKSSSFQRAGALAAKARPRSPPGVRELLRTLDESERDSPFPRLPPCEPGPQREKYPDSDLLRAATVVRSDRFGNPLVHIPGHRLHATQPAQFSRARATALAAIQ